MARHTEPLNGGLWTGADPGTLEAGQLIDIRNGIYLRGSQAIFRAPGRVAFGTVSAVATGVVGLRDVQFDNGDQYLIAHAGTLYRRAPIGDTGTFSDLATVATGLSLEAAQYRNRFYLMNGAFAQASSIGTNQVVYLSATAVGSAPVVRQHGMLAVDDDLEGVTAAGTFSQTVTGYYEYWVTEIAKLTADGVGFEMESTFSGTPWTAPVLSVSTVPILTLPAMKNSITTHWRVYRSPKKDASADKKFPTGFEIATFATASGAIVSAATAVADTSTTTDTGFKFPTLANTGTLFDKDFANADRLTADDGSYASSTHSAGIPGLSEITTQGVYQFDFGGFRGPIKGIEVVVEGYISSGSTPVPIWVRIGKDRNANGSFAAGNDHSSLGFGLAYLQLLSRNTAKKSGLITATSAPGTTVTFGGPTDRWFPQDKTGLVDTDFGPNFMVILGYGPGVNSRTVLFDYVKVKVYYGATHESVLQFPTVVYTFGDISAQVGKNGPPPSANTGDVFEDSLVTNEMTNAAVIRWSYPGDPEAFPETYFVDFETRENDRVRAIRVVNDRLVVWLDRSTWRMNYLPSERDASFDRGKSKQTISSSYGCVNPMCVTTYSPGGDREWAAYVSHQGICATDGFEFQFLTDALEWRDIISTTTTSTPIALVNDLERKLLLFYFRNDAYTPETYLCLAMSYDSDHLIEGKLKMCGLTHMRNHAAGQFASVESAWVAPRSNGNASVYIGYGGTDTTAGAGKVYIETGTSMPALDPRLQYTTRRMYLAGLGNEWQFGELYGYCHDYGSTTPALTYTLTTTKTNDTGPSTKGSKSITLGGQALHKAGLFQTVAEGATISMVATASGLAHEFLIIDGTDFGEEDSGRA